MIAGTDIPLPSNSPALTPGQPCSGCHQISRDGRRFSYSFNGANFEIGTLVYDEAQKMFVITAIDLEKLAQSPEDPSRAPFWIPGQSVNNQYVSPQWTKAVLPVPQ